MAKILPLYRMLRAEIVVYREVGLMEREEVCKALCEILEEDYETEEGEKMPQSDLDENYVSITPCHLAIHKMV